MSDFVLENLAYQTEQELRRQTPADVIHKALGSPTMTAQVLDALYEAGWGFAHKDDFASSREHVVSFRTAGDRT